MLARLDEVYLYIGADTSKLVYLLLQRVMFIGSKYTD